MSFALVKVNHKKVFAPEFLNRTFKILNGATVWPTEGYKKIRLNIDLPKSTIWWKNFAWEFFSILIGPIWSRDPEIIFVINGIKTLKASDWIGIGVIF